MSLALLRLVLTTAAVAAVAAVQSNLLPADTQLPDFKKATECPIGVLKTGVGAPVDVRHTKTLNSDVIRNEYMMEEFQSSCRCRVAERAVHALGCGGKGTFVVTNDITKYCKSKVFSKIGKETPVFVRMSLTRSRQGSPDTTQGSRGCAFKFYTEEGNWDLTGFSVPISPNKDPYKFLAVMSTLRENAQTGLTDPNMRWDFVIQNPEAMFKAMYEFSDYGAPATLKDMPCHTIHTYQVYNEKGESSYIRFSLIPCKGSKFLNGTEASNLAAGDRKFYTKDFYNSIATGDYPCYVLYGQILSEEDRKNADMDIFDITKVLDEKRYPYTEIGRVTINKNCENHFEETEAVAFSPGNCPTGICGAPDKVFATRCSVYRDSAIYRMGSNFKNLPVNRPKNGPVHNYIRDGVPQYNPAVGRGPTYYPNMFNGPVPIFDKNRPELIQIHEQPANNFEQAGNFYSKVLTPSQQTTLINNIVKDISKCDEDIKKEAIKLFKKIDNDFAERVAKDLGLSA